MEQLWMPVTHSSMSAVETPRQHEEGRGPQAIPRPDGAPRVLGIGPSLPSVGCSPEHSPVPALLFIGDLYLIYLLFMIPE